VIIRRAEGTDWAAIWPIWHAIVAAGDTYTYDPASSSAAAGASWLAPSPDEAWLAELDAAVLGTYHLAPNQPGPGSHIANASYMVAEAARGRGVGRAMVEHSLARAREAGYLGIQFNAVAETNVHAIRLYEQLGFTTVGVVPRAFRHPTAGLVGLRVMYRDV
jgi:ribosomal protein S18 acetylase RimI-like enzyme